VVTESKFINNKKEVSLDVSGATFADVIAVARFDAKVSIAPTAITAMNTSRKFIEDMQRVGNRSMEFQLDSEPLLIYISMLKIESNYRNHLYALMLPELAQQ